MERYHWQTDVEPAREFSSRDFQNCGSPFTKPLAKGPNMEEALEPMQL
jgi:hypothetical protein